MRRNRWVPVLLLLMALGCASTPDRGRGENGSVPVTPPTQPIEQLLANLRSSQPITRAGAAWQLAGVVGPDPTITDALQIAYTDPDEKVQEAAAWALARRGATAPYSEPPRPLKITRPSYPQPAFIAKIQGTVLVDILISASGQVVHAEVRRSIPGLDAAALATVKGWSFEPARLKGEPIPVVAQAPVTFRITN